MSSTLQMPWDQMEGETDVYFNHFKKYLLMPERPRRYATIAEQIGVRADHLREVGSWFSWTSRARAYDAYIAGITEKERREAIKAYQLEVIQTAVQDGRRMRAEWEKKFEGMVSGEISTLDLIRLVQARNLIDLIVRRAAELPATYNSDVPKELPPDDATYKLTADGIKVDRTATAITRSSGEYQ